MLRLPLVVCLAVVLVTAPAPAQKKEKKVEPPRKGGDAVPARR
jgi:hypothetical protein